MATTVIKPGILVALRSSVVGGVTYSRADLGLEEEEATAVAQLSAEASVEKWETTKIVTDPQEFKRAGDVRSKAAAEVRKVCIQTSFGLLAPADREAELDAAAQKARELIGEFNASSQHSKVSIYLLKGRIASTDEEAVRAIGAEVSALVVEMNQGIDRLDPEAIRKAASAAAQLGAVLDARQQQVVSAAVEAARKAARTITKRVEKEGEAGSVVLASLQRDALETARITFLDLEEVAPANDGEALPAVDLQRAASLDVGEAPVPEPPPESPSAPSAVPEASAPAVPSAAPAASPEGVAPVVPELDFAESPALPPVAASPAVDPWQLDFGGADAL